MLLCTVRIWVVLLAACGKFAWSQGDNCTNGTVRLVDGRNQQEGRVELCYGEQWGTVCDDLWDNRDASVVCRQLGFSPNGSRATGGGVFPPGGGRILLDNVNCAGEEQTLLSCSTNGIGIHNCDHFEDAGVVCELIGFSCRTGDVRLVGGNASNEGRVEVCDRNTYRTVCDDGTWDVAEAKVVCNQLNFGSTDAYAISGGSFPPGIGTQLFGLQCNGSEFNLMSCRRTPTFRSIFCTHRQDAGVLCRPVNATCTNREIRLFNGRIHSEGRVEVCYNNHWGTICHNGWGVSEARVVCSELGYSRNGSIPMGYGDYGLGEGLILLSNLRCQGSEARLADCPSNPVGSNFCSHIQDSGVICVDPNNTCIDGDLQLIDGDTHNEGRLEICYGNHWGTVCDDSFDSTDAAVACKLLGFNPNNSVALHAAFFGAGVGIILLDDVECVGNETSLLNCTHLGIGLSNCQHREDVSLLCQVENASCANGDVRLVNGSGPHSGRVEVCFNGRWGTVCDDSWDINDAAVVCRQLNYSTEGAVALSGAYYGQGSGPIFLDNADCSLENDSTLLQCFVGNVVGIHNCVHAEDASVICPVPGGSCDSYFNGDIRLVGGRSEMEGRVELCLDGNWGTICDNAWTNLDAAVACSQLKYSRTDAMAEREASFGQGSGTIHLDSFYCLGNEERLTDCIHRKATRCTHAQDAGVVCSAVTSCADGDLRLVGGSHSSAGRVEVCFNQQFGTVCDDFWDNNDARVVCRQLGFDSNGAIALPRAFFGSGTSYIHLDNVQCVGNETSLLNCPYVRNPFFCFHFEDAAVLCQSENASLVCKNGDLRLVGSDSPYEGNVEVCFNGQWGTICHDRWDSLDAQVVCRVLMNSSEGAIAARRAYFGYSTATPILLDEVSCNGTETSILQCLSQDAGMHDCSHLHDAGVLCLVSNSSWPCQSGQVRLVGGQAVNEGRVEICVNGKWGTVCDDLWDENDANVVCNHLGFEPEGSVAVGRAGFGAGRGPIYLANLRCNGTEENLLECPSIGPGAFCIHSEDAGVICKVNVNCHNGDIRLVGGEGENEGTVEICRDNQWAGTVCDDEWDQKDAAVVCRQLGFGTENAIALRMALFGRGQGSILMDNVACVGNESRLDNCSHDSTHNCFHYEDAGVICPPENANCSDGAVRLADGRNEFEGRVEVCLHGRWGTVCDDFWDGRDAAVVCRQLNFTQNGHAYSVRSAYFGQGNGRIYLDNVQCVGSESTLLACRAQALGTHNCRPTEDAGVFCPYPGSPCKNGDVRLVGGETTRLGRVEFCRGGEWGTVCADFYWNYRDAQVVCRQLGFDPQGVSALTGSVFGGGEGPIFLSQLNCNGSESRLVDCPLPGFPSFNLWCADHSNDAGVVCRDPNVTCPQGAVRLVDGVTPNEGRVEICLDNQWGTVCDDLWDANSAAVVCRQLNFTSQGAVPLSSAFFGHGFGPISLDDVVCTGLESSLLNCSQDRSHDCSHSEDAGVICIEPSSTCTHGDLRLVGGQSTLEGRVEICIGGRWGTVCDDQWDVRDASVVCRQLGFSPNGSAAAHSASFGVGTGPIFLDDVRCFGNESRLFNCTALDLGVHNCRHSEDAGVICQEIPCLNGTMRLMDGANNYSGRVEVCINGKWGTVCGDSFTQDDAKVVCSRLGLRSTEAIRSAAGFFGQGTGSVFREVCTTESSCNTSSTCDHTRDAGAFCSEAGNLACRTGEVRLAGGRDNKTEGRVEMCFNNMWGTVCDDSWDDQSAKVVCRQLGLPFDGATAVLTSDEFGAGSGPIHLDDVKCEGEEINLLSCSQLPKTIQHNCKHSEDAGVTCQAGGTKTPTSGTKTPPTSGTTGGGIVNVGRLDGGETAAIVAPIMIVLLIIVVVIVIAVTVVVIYRLRRTGKFSSGPDMVPFSTFPDKTESIPEKVDTV